MIFERGVARVNLRVSRTERLRSNFEALRNIKIRYLQRSNAMLLLHRDSVCRPRLILDKTFRPV